MYLKIGFLLVLCCFLGNFCAAGDHVVGREVNTPPTAARENGHARKPHPVTEPQSEKGQLINVTYDPATKKPREITTVAELKKFIRENTPRGFQPVLLLSGEEWCGPCKQLAAGRLKGELPKRKVIFEMVVPAVPTSNPLYKAILLTPRKAPMLSYMRRDASGNLVGTRPMFPSIWSFEGVDALDDPNKSLIEEGVALAGVTKWLDNPPEPTIDNGAWF